MTPTGLPDMGVRVCRIENLHDRSSKHCRPVRTYKCSSAMYDEQRSAITADGGSVDIRPVSHDLLPLASSAFPRWRCHCRCPRSVICLIASDLTSSVYLMPFTWLSPFRFRHYQVSSRAGEVHLQRRICVLVHCVLTKLDGR